MSPADEVRERVAQALHLGLDEVNDAPGWVERIQEWADWIHQQYEPLIVQPQGVTARQFGCCDIADDPNERGAVERSLTEDDAREDAASWSTGRLVYRDVTYGPWRFAN